MLGLWEPTSPCMPCIFRGRHTGKSAPWLITKTKLTILLFTGRSLGEEGADGFLLNFLSQQFSIMSHVCPTCHANFDTMVDPVFILIPTDINYFIEFEGNDRDRRQRTREVHGKTPQGEFPTTAQYKEHQTAQGLVPPDAVRGLYQPVFLKSFLHSGLLPFDIEQYFTHPRPCHGAPSASLRRAMHVLGGARLGKLGPVTLQQLWTLQKLYFLDNDEDDFVEQHETARTGQKQGYGHKGHGQSRGPDDSSEPDDSNKPDDSEQSLAKKQRISSHHINFERATTFPPFLSNILCEWDWGPHITAQDAIQRFAPYV